jgi:hypothetical protein
MMPTKSKNNIVLLFFEKQNENGGMNLQKTQESTKELKISKIEICNDICLKLPKQIFKDW